MDPGKEKYPVYTLACSVLVPVSQCSPANVSDVYPRVRFDFCTVLVPGSPDVLFRHLALKESLILGLHREVGDALVDLQLLLYTVRTMEDRGKEKNPGTNAREDRVTNLSLIKNNKGTVYLRVRFSFYLAVSKQQTEWEYLSWIRIENKQMKTRCCC